MGTSNGTTADDDWGFGAAVLPEEDDILVTDGETRIRFEVKRQSESVIGFLAKFSNTTTSPITSLAFQIATPKVSKMFPRPPDDADLTTVNCV